MILNNPQGFSCECSYCWMILGNLSNASEERRLTSEVSCCTSKKMESNNAICDIINIKYKLQHQRDEPLLMKS